MLQGCLESDAEALEQQQETDLQALRSRHDDEIREIAEGWGGTKADLNAHLRPKKAEHRDAMKETRSDYAVRIKDGKARQKVRRKTLTAELMHLDTELPQAERELKLITNRGRLTLILEDPDLIGTLKERWIGAEVAKRLDYPIFMAVSERGGKNNSGDYEYLRDSDGSFIEFRDGHPQAGQQVTDQDLVNFELTAADLVDASQIPSERLCIAEAFVQFAQGQGLGFWGVE